MSRRSRALRTVGVASVIVAVLLAGDVAFNKRPHHQAATAARATPTSEPAAPEPVIPRDPMAMTDAEFDATAARTKAALFDPSRINPSAPAVQQQQQQQHSLRAQTEAELAGTPILATGSMGGDQFPALSAYRVIDHPPLSVPEGHGFEVFRRPAYEFVAVRVPYRDMPSDLCLLVIRWTTYKLAFSATGARCFWREYYAVGNSDWMVVPLRDDNVAPEAMSALLADGSRRFLWPPVKLRDLPTMRYEELENVK